MLVDHTLKTAKVESYQAILETIPVYEAQLKERLEAVVLRCGKPTTTRASHLYPQAFGIAGCTPVLVRQGGAHNAVTLRLENGFQKGDREDVRCHI